LINLEKDPQIKNRGPGAGEGNFPESPSGKWGTMKKRRKDHK